MNASDGATMPSEERPEGYQETPEETIQQVMKERGYMCANEFRTWLAWISTEADSPNI